jgi:hypothetical protein
MEFGMRVMLYSPQEGLDAFLRKLNQKIQQHAG